MQKLFEAFSLSMEKYIGDANWKKMEEYLSKFPYFDKEKSSYFSFPDDAAAFEVSTQIIKDAKALVAEGKGGPALNYILYRCAGIINTSGRKYNAARNSSVVHLDITGTGFSEFIGYISEAYIKLAEIGGVVDKFPLEKFTYGDLINNISARLGDELKNIGRDLMAQEHSNGVNYDGVRSKSVVTHDKDTGKYFIKATGEEIDADTAKDLQAKANIRRMARAKSFDGTDTNDYNDDSGVGSSMDKLVSEYADATGDNLGEFEDELIKNLDGPQIIEDWKNCCMDTEWTKKNNIKAELLKTVLDDAVSGTYTNQIDFINKYHLNKQTFRNYMGLSDKKTYPGVSVRDILDDYEVEVDELIKYIKDHPEKKDAILGLLPGGRLHEALIRYMENRKKLQEAAAANALREAELCVKLSEDVKPYYDSYKATIEEAIATIDWSETDKNGVAEFFESNLKDGIAAHRNTWKFMTNTFDWGLNKFQKGIITEALKG